MHEMRILIVNDSRAMRLFLENVVNSFGDCTVSGSYFDGEIALENVQSIKPDVILLDLEMPKMDGLTFLENLIDARKTPIIILSSYAMSDSSLVHDAMELGAVDSLTPPSSNTSEMLDKFRSALHHKITMASLKSPRFNRTTCA